VESNLVTAVIIALGQALRRLLPPARFGAKLLIGAAGDLTRSRSELMAENALLRQQLIVLRGGIERPRGFRTFDTKSPVKEFYIFPSVIIEHSPATVASLCFSRILCFFTVFGFKRCQSGSGPPPPGTLRQRLR